MAISKFIFYRILGNDIPPRHRKGQTLANLRIILNREPAFKNVEKRWVINRVVDPLEERKIIKFLEQHSQKYQVINCDSENFRMIPKDSFNERHDQIIGLNSARNLALREGKRLGRWVLVFDGSCFFTFSAWKEVVQACSRKGDFKYVVVPMLRIGHGAKGIPCEPQIIFRNDSREEFDERFRYGQNSKLEMLCRLGVPGLWDQWDTTQSILQKKRRSKDFGAFIKAGYVWRMPSGNLAAEEDVKKREAYRKRGILLLMNKIEKIYERNNKN